MIGFVNLYDQVGQLKKDVAEIFQRLGAVLEKFRLFRHEEETEL